MSAAAEKPIVDPLPPRTWFTLRQVADRWNVSTRHLYYEISRKKLRATKIGSATRVSSDEVIRYEANATVIGRTADDDFLG
ncbi:MAG: helix-turn-helix domain-containing protein [Alsobacter sp.]